MAEENKKDAPVDPKGSAELKKEEPKDEKGPNKPKQQQQRPPVVIEGKIEIQGEKGDYTVLAWGPKIDGKYIGEVSIKTFLGNSRYPECDLASSGTGSISFRVHFSKEKEVLKVIIGDIVITKELDGPEKKSSSSISEEEKTMGWWELTLKTIGETFAEWRKK